MPYQYDKLKGRIVEMYGTKSNFAKVLGISLNSLGKKLNCKTQFSQTDIEEWSKLLSIDKKDVVEYFFT